MKRPTPWGVAIVASAVAACAPGDAERRSAETSALISNRNLDLLFMIDNSASMALSQTNLLRNFPAFMNVLKDLPGGLPNIHVAVVSSDMGVAGAISTCSDTGDNGVFHFAPRGTCTSTTLQSGATYISNVGGVANYTAPDIATVFSCMAALGQEGCGFERPFASVLRALGADGQPMPPENQGFLRSDALLAIVMVSNEDDCSVPADIAPAFYSADSDQGLTSPPYGPVGEYRCYEFGHVCDGVRPPRFAPNGQEGDTVTLQSCSSSECDGVLTPVGEVAARLKALKAAPASEILVAAITGPVTPYQVRWRPSIVVGDTSCGMASCPWPQIEHSCTASDSSYANPAVRITQLTTAFGVNGFASSICDADFSPALQQIASRIGTLLAAGGGVGSPNGSIPTCATTGFGGQGGASDSTGAGGSSAGAGGVAGAANNPGSDAAAGTGMPPGDDGCGCHFARVRARLGTIALACAVGVLLARRRRGRGPSSPRC